MSDCRLYLISPPALEPDTFAEAFELALSGGDIASFQLRLKECDDDALKRAVERLLPIAHAHDVAFILNDRPDLAAALGCDGVHIGQEDGTLVEAREQVGANAIIGVTCHDSRHLALEAAEGGADYVAFGAFFDTGTKVPKSRAEPDLLRWWHDVIEVPCVAIGGITVGNCRPLVEAGADFLCVSAGIWEYPEGPAASVTAFNEICTSTDVAPPAGS
jgi:thiamine-phosphate pyrophosphorylase